MVVAAPGDGSNDLTCGIGSDSNYRNGFGGTSGATPKVAATAALMLSVAPSLTHQQIRSILNSTGGPVVTAAGRPVGTFLNCEAAVRQAKRATRRLEVIARGADKAIWHNWQTTPGNAWSGWSSLGGWVDLAHRRVERGWAVGGFRPWCRRCGVAQLADHSGRSVEWLELAGRLGRPAHRGVQRRRAAGGLRPWCRWCGLE